MTKHPLEIDGREVGYCLFCGEELVGYSELGKLENDVYDEENYERILDFFLEEQGVESVEADNVHGFWMVDSGEWIVACTGGKYELYAFARGIGEHNTAKQIGKYETVEEIINEIRERTDESK